jgi:hypothetical protein
MRCCKKSETGQPTRRASWTAVDEHVSGARLSSSRARVRLGSYVACPTGGNAARPMPVTAGGVREGTAVHDAAVGVRMAWGGRAPPTVTRLAWPWRTLGDAVGRRLPVPDPLDDHQAAAIDTA